MANIIKNDVGALSLRTIINVIIVIVVVLAVAFTIWKQFRRVFFPAPVDADKCKADKNYEYKDPDKHPNDCH